MQPIDKLKVTYKSVPTLEVNTGYTVINGNKKNYNMKYHVILGRFKWLINVSPSLEGIRYPRSVYVLSFVCFFLVVVVVVFVFT